MRVAECSTRKVVVARRSTSIAEAARLMRQYHIGALVVTGDGADDVKPVGIVTDRDLVVEILAKEIDPTDVSVGDVMSPDLVVAREDDDLFQTLDMMRERGVRRVPVIDDDAQLAGILSVDDVLALLASAISRVPQLMRTERSNEAFVRV